MENASIIRRPRRAVRPPAGRKGGISKSAKKRTAGTHHNGFLNHVFEPFLGIPFKDWRSVEQAFFASLENLCDLYGWTKPEVTGLSFPDNIAEAYEALKEGLPPDFDLQLKICQDKLHECGLVTAKTLDTGYHLYYIPVRPVWKMRGMEQEQSCYDMLIAIFAYLYQVAGVPFFNEPGTIDGNYDNIRNWLEELKEDDGEVFFRQRQIHELKALEQAGEILQAEIQRPFQLSDLETIFHQNQKQDQADGDLNEMVEEFIKLIKDYPKRSIKESMYYEDEPGDNITIYWEQYISFYWSGADCLWETLFQMVNDEFQEMGYQEEPVSVQWFDRPQGKPCHEFDFEARFFSLMERLSDLLNDYDHEEFNQ